MTVFRVGDDSDLLPQELLGEATRRRLRRGLSRARRSPDVRVDTRTPLPMEYAHHVAQAAKSSARQSVSIVIEVKRDHKLGSPQTDP